MIIFKDYKMIEKISDTIGIEYLIRYLMLNPIEDKENWQSSFPIKSNFLFGGNKIIGYHRVEYIFIDGDLYIKKYSLEEVKKK